MTKRKNKRKQSNRIANWQIALASYVASVRFSPFDYGKNDCALFCAGAVKAMTGVDLSEQFKPYTSRAAGLRLVRKAGYKDHVDVFAKALVEVDVADAKPGDVVVLPGASLGIVQGANVYALSDQGLGLALMKEAERAFRV